MGGIAPIRCDFGAPAVFTNTDSRKTQAKKIRKTVLVLPTIEKSEVPSLAQHHLSRHGAKHVKQTHRKPLKIMKKILYTIMWSWFPDDNRWSVRHRLPASTICRAPSRSKLLKEPRKAAETSTRPTSGDRHKRSFHATHASPRLRSVWSKVTTRQSPCHSFRQSPHVSHW